MEGLAGAPEEIREVLQEHPELQAAWEDAAAYRESFASPEEARQATRIVSDLNRLDALFFSARPEDHAELARVVSELDPAAAASLASFCRKFMKKPWTGPRARSQTVPPASSASPAYGVIVAAQ